MALKTPRGWDALTPGTYRAEVGKMWVEIGFGPDLNFELGEVIFSTEDGVQITFRSFQMSNARYTYDGSSLNEQDSALYIARMTECLLRLDVWVYDGQSASSEERAGSGHHIHHKLDVLECDKVHLWNVKKIG